MYPDPEHFFNEEGFEDFYCPNIHEQEFMNCLIENEVTSNDTTNSEYLSCLEKKKKRFQKCNEDRGNKYVLRRHVTRTRPKKCDKFNVVYYLTKDESNFLKPYDDCSRPFVVMRIAHSNLILLITNRICAQVFATKIEFADVPQTIDYVNSTFCHKLTQPPLFRNRPSNKTCVDRHHNVSFSTILRDS